MNHAYEPWCKQHLDHFRNGKGKWGDARCPLHSDRKPSLRVDLDSGGYKCHSGNCPRPNGHVRQLAADLNLPLDDLPETESPTKMRAAALTEVAAYYYPSPDGSHLGLVCRYWDSRTASKTFRQFHRAGGTWKVGAGPVRFPLYRADQLASTLPGSLVLFLEGEKAVEAAVRLGFEATTSAAGADAFSRCDRDSLRLLAGRRVVILPDNDEPGRSYAREVGTALAPQVESLAVLELPKLPEKGDLVDWETSGGTAETLRQLTDAAPSWADWNSSVRIHAPAAARIGEADEVDLWEPLVPFNEEPRPSFPLEALPDALSAYVQAVSRSMQVPVDLPALFVLGLLASAVQKKVDFECGPDQVYPLNLWTLVVYPSGGGKSRAMVEIQAPLVQQEREMQARVVRQNEEAEEQKAETQARLEELGRKKGRSQDEDQEMSKLRGRLRSLEVQPLPELFTSESTSEALEQKLIANEGRMAVWNAEGGDLFEILGGRYSATGSSNLGIWLKGFSQESTRTGRVLRGTNWIHKPTLSLALAVQPVVFESIVRRADFEKRGLTARFLVAVPPSMLGFREVDPPPIPPELRARFTAIARSLTSIQVSKDEHGQPVAHRLLLTLQAKQALLKFAQWAEVELRPEGALCEVREFGARLKEHLVKVAGLLHCSLHPSEPWETHVSGETIERAARIVQWSAEHVRLSLGNSAGAERVSRAEYLLEKIAANPDWHSGFKLRDLFQAVRQKRWYPELGPLVADLNFLCERSYLREMEAASGKRGRPSKVYLVSPHLDPKKMSSKYSKCGNIDTATV